MGGKVRRATPGDPDGRFTLRTRRLAGFAPCRSGSGSATDDFYGAFRKGDNLFANSVLALDAKTGERKWHYQTVHHDIWDFDNPPAPILITVNDGDVSRDAVVQLTKMGLTFVLDRDTGEPIFPVEERPVPRSDVPGEQAAARQPYPVLPPPLVRQAITEADLTNISPEAHQRVVDQFGENLSAWLTWRNDRLSGFQCPSSNKHR